jgi:hypothetical protein
MRAAPLVAAGAMACGPSFQAVYECEVRFEHCYALDQDPHRIEAQKACWRVWLHDYTYGQSRDKVEYAEARFSELSLDPTLPSEDVGVRPHRRRDNASPLPTSAFAPPPNVAGDGVVAGAASQAAAQAQAQAAQTQQGQPTIAGATPPRTGPGLPTAPGEQCTDACAQRWTACRKGCTDGQCNGCDAAYKACVPACFQEVQTIPRSIR